MLPVSYNDQSNLIGSGGVETNFLRSCIVNCFTLCWEMESENLKWQIDWYRASLALCIYCKERSEVLVCVLFLHACLAKSVSKVKLCLVNISCTCINLAVAKYVRHWVSVVKEAWFHFKILSSLMWFYKWTRVRRHFAKLK